MPYKDRPTIPEWPGHGCSRAFWEAPYRGAQIAFDKALRHVRATVKAALTKAMEAQDAEALTERTKDMQAINEGKLPVERHAQRFTSSGARICAPGGLTRAQDMTTPTRWIK